MNKKFIQMGKQESNWYTLEFSEPYSGDTKKALQDIYDKWKEIDLLFSSVDLKKEILYTQEYKNIIAQRVESFLLLNGARMTLAEMKKVRGY